MSASDSSRYKRPVEILQKLIQFDTTNPPGNEKACIEFIAELLREVGVEPEIFCKDPSRPNLVSRIKGNDEAPALLLYGHVDVVTARGGEWTHDPFDGIADEKFVWGRGTLDMKGGLVMFLSAFLRMQVEGITPAGDIVFAALSDEENGGVFGAGYLVEKQKQVFAGVKYSLGEFGGFSLEMAGKHFYPIQVAEKQLCTMELKIRGAGGHGSAYIPGNAIEVLGKVIDRISNKSLPVHITDPVKDMLSGISENLTFPMRPIIRLLLFPALTKKILALFGESGLLFRPLFHNTVNPTLVRGGEKDNVVPSEVTLTLDGRLLPGFSSKVMVSELRELITGLDVEIAVTRCEEGPPSAEMGLFSLLSEVIKDLDPAGFPVPMLLPAVTDARHLAKIGIQSYGFTPLKLEPGMNFFSSIHGVDERISIEALKFGCEAVFQVLKQYRG